MKKLQVVIVAAALAGATSARASLTVTIDTPSPAQTVTLSSSGSISFSAVGVYAGIYNETVDGVATPSLCIDVYRDVTIGETFNNYYYTDLADAPLTPAGPMGAAAATGVEKLWAAYYNSAVADLTGQTAAALQVAVWEETAANPALHYTLTVSGNAPVISQAGGMLTALNDGSLTAQTGLEGLVSPTGQNYVVVPEPPTMIAGALLLLPFGASTLRTLRKSRKA
jgi:hypothetical protein